MDGYIQRIVLQTKYDYFWIIIIYKDKNMKEKMKIYFVEYKNKGGFTYGEEIEALSENQAVKMVQMELINEGDYMSELRSVEEMTPELKNDLENTIN